MTFGTLLKSQEQSAANSLLVKIKPRQPDKITSLIIKVIVAWQYVTIADRAVCKDAISQTGDIVIQNKDEYHILLKD